jgi:hypothetical protein
MSGMTLTPADRDRYASARALGEREARNASAVTAARYLSRRDSIELVFGCGGTMTIPRMAIPEFADAPADAMKGLTVSVAGDVITCRALDVDVAVPGLVETVFGPRLLSSAFARRGPLACASSD